MPRLLRFLSALLLACALSVAPAQAQGVSVALTPDGQQVLPGAIFTIDVTITAAGSPFNGFDAIIGYDPAALTLLPTAPTSLQQGSLMTSACGNTFHVFRQGAATDTVTCVLLCSGVSVTGPGQLYKLQFQASNTPQVTTVRLLPGLRFYDAGLYVNPLYSTDATIGIGMPVAVDEGSGAAGKTFALTITPNPTRRGAVFTLEADRPGLQKVGIFDVRGRPVHRFEEMVAAAGTRALKWDGADSAGHAVPPGVYFVTYEVAGRTVSSRITLIR
jgi:hypothetical protein